MTRRPWRITEENYLKENYDKKSYPEIAKHLNRPVSSVRTYAFRTLGLSVPKDSLPSRGGTFKEGHTPHHANTKGVMKSNSSSFKKGTPVPRRVYAEGEIRIFEKKERNASKRREKEGVGYTVKRYKEIYTGGKWIKLHIHNWILENGPIPPGHVVTFVSIDTLNCLPHNLELLTRAEFMNKNNNIAKASQGRKDYWKRIQLLESCGLETKHTKRFAKKNPKSFVPMSVVGKEELSIMFHGSASTQKQAED